MKAKLLITAILLLAHHSNAFLFPIGPVCDPMKSVAIGMKGSQTTAQTGVEKTTKQIHKQSLDVQKNKQQKALKAQQEANRPATSTKRVTANTSQDNTLKVTTEIGKQSTNFGSAAFENTPTSSVTMLNGLAASQKAVQQLREDNEAQQNQLGLAKSQLRLTGALEQEALNWNATVLQKNTASSVRQARNLDAADRINRAIYGQ